MHFSVNGRTLASVRQFFPVPAGSQSRTADDEGGRFVRQPYQCGSARDYFAAKHSEFRHVDNLQGRPMGRAPLRRLPPIESPAIAARCPLDRLPRLQQHKANDSRPLCERSVEKVKSWAEHYESKGIFEKRLPAVRFSAVNNVRYIPGRASAIVAVNFDRQPDIKTASTEAVQSKPLKGILKPPGGTPQSSKFTDLLERLDRASARFVRVKERHAECMRSVAARRLWALQSVNPRENVPEANANISPRDPGTVKLPRIDHPWTARKLQTWD